MEPVFTTSGINWWRTKIMHQSGRSKTILLTCQVRRPCGLWAGRATQSVPVETDRLARAVAMRQCSNETDQFLAFCLH